MISFRARIDIVGVNPFVRVPRRVSLAFGKRGYVPVRVHLERGVLPSTLVPVGGGVHRLYINTQMLKVTSSRVGKMIRLGLTFDPSSRMPKMSPRLRRVIASQPGAMARWNALNPSRRKEILRYLGFAKTSETRRRNEARLLSILGSSRGAGVLSGIQIVSSKKTTARTRSAPAKNRPGSRP